MTDTPGALDGLRVIDLGLLVQGPQAAQTLGDMGADVIKVELPRLGDQGRWIPLTLEDRRAPYFVACNRGKRSLTLDLRHDDGKRVFRKLVDSADVLIANFKPGTLDEWGLGYQTLCETNPGLVFALGSTYGPEGPAAGREGVDLLGQAAGGLISTTGSDGEAPTPVGATIADHIASQNMVAGILAALLVRQRTGRGQRIDVSLLGGQIYAQASEYTAYLLNGKPPGRANRGHPLLPTAYAVFATADGHVALAGVLLPKRAAFYEAMGVPELNEDPRFQPLLYTAEVRRQLFEILDARFAKRTSTEWVETLCGLGLRCAPVQDYAQAAADPQVIENDYLVELDHPDGGRVRVVGSPIRMSETPTRTAPIAPELGQHSEEILLELGYAWDEIEALKERGAV